MSGREASAALAVLGAGELFLARATSGPLPTQDVFAALLGWGILQALCLSPILPPRAVVEVATLAVAAHVALPPVWSAGGPVATVVLGLMLAAATVATRDVRATTLTPLAVVVATLLATLAGPAPPWTRLLEGLLGVAAAWLIATRGRIVLVLPLAGLAAMSGGARFPTRDARPDVVIVTVDALRADVADKLPSFRRIAAKGRGYEAWAPAPWTLPSLAGLHTGAPAHVVGAGRSGDGFAPVRDDLPTLAERLGAAGWRTIAMSGGNPFTGPRYGLQRGFREVWHPWEPVAAPLPRLRAPYVQARPLMARAFAAAPPARDDADALVDRALHRLRQLDRPRFLWLHLRDVHLPYDAPPCRPEVLGQPGARTALLDDPWWSSLEGRACLRTSYEAAAAKVDAALTRLLDGLDLDRTVVVLTSDHGEALGEVGFEHGHTLQPEVSRVPLAIHVPWRMLRAVPGPVSLTDVGATLLAVLDLPPSLPGLDLRSGTPPGPTPLSNVLYGPPRRGDVAGDWLLVETAGQPRTYAWRRPIASRGAPPLAPPEVVERLTRWLPEVPAADEAVRGDAERLRALGYVE